MKKLKKAEKTTSVEPVMIYYKTGDDFEMWLGRSKGDVSAAYAAWADSLEEGVKYLRTMSERLRGSGASGDGGANSISLSVPASLAKAMVAEKLVRFAPECCDDQGAHG